MGVVWFYTKRITQSLLCCNLVASEQRVLKFIPELEPELAGIRSELAPDVLARL